MLRMMIMLIPLLPMTARAQDAEWIQKTLDTDGHVRLGARRYTLERPLVLRAGMKLEGSGFATVLHWVSASPTHGPYAVRFGERGYTNYGCSLSDLRVNGGGVLLSRIGQHCVMERVWASGGPEDGFRIDADGDYMRLTDCIAWENHGNGFTVITRISQNGITLDHCNAQGNKGHGVEVLTAGSFHSYLDGLMLRDCVIQGNCRGRVKDAEILLSGLPVDTVLDHCFVESTRSAVALRMSALTLPDDPRPRSPVNVLISNSTELQAKSAPCVVDVVAGAGLKINNNARVRGSVRVTFGLSVPVIDTPYPTALQWATADGLNHP